jgi:hypothetical protein
VVDFIVTAVESRREYVEYMQKHIPNLIVVWDEKNDAMDTFMRAWGQYPDRASVRLQDDLCLTKNFVEKVMFYIKQYPNDVIKFFSRSKYDITKGTRWRLGSKWMMNQCYYLPKGTSGKIFDFANQWERMEDHPNGDDELMAEFFQKNKIKHLNVCPSMVEHAEIVSAIDKRRARKRQSTTFVDPELDGFPM